MTDAVDLSDLMLGLTPLTASVLEVCRAQWRWSFPPAEVDGVPVRGL